MLVARLLCSDPECAEAVAARAETLAELETLACACGCGLEVLGWPDWEAPGADPPGADVVALQVRVELAEAA